MGDDPARSGHGSWFDFVRDMGDPVDPRAQTTVAGLLRQIETDRALTPHAIAALETLRPGRSASEEGLAYLALNPLLRRDGSRLTLTRPDPDGTAAAMIAELLEWRAGQLREPVLQEPAAPFITAGPELWREYLREAIPPLFGATFNTGSWNAGIVRLDRDLILLTTLKKCSLSAGNHYEDRFLAPDRMQWQSQTQTRRDSQIGRLLAGRTKPLRGIGARGWRSASLSALSFV